MMEIATRKTVIYYSFIKYTVLASLILRCSAKSQERDTIMDDNKEKEMPAGTPSLSAALAEGTPGKGKLNIEIKATFELDDARIFDLNGDGLTIACVTSN